ncbi:hypothetical protein MKW98_010522 [Papaver atlanticum]|uniref:Peroxidase n=1 Tax=Papaver atlanticum TaxID=357466 RepID=A0AAD4S271_9MAGN|nr:hypothetical protein MKW98_010522 [Papaver atlanticum]
MVGAISMIESETLNHFPIVAGVASVVSCSDILVLAARDSVEMELPALDDDLSAILLKFFTRNFHRTRNTRSFGCVQSELVVWCTAGGGS